MSDTTVNIYEGLSAKQVVALDNIMRVQSLTPETLLERFGEDTKPFLILSALIDEIDRATLESIKGEDPTDGRLFRLDKVIAYCREQNLGVLADSLQRVFDDVESDAARIKRVTDQATKRLWIKGYNFEEWYQSLLASLRATTPDGVSTDQLDIEVVNALESVPQRDANGRFVKREAANEPF